MRTVEKNQCVLCQSSGVTLYHGIKDRLFGVPGEWSLSCCTNKDCGLIWLNPVPSEEEMVKCYTSYYTHGEGRESILRYCVRNIYNVVSSIPEIFCGLHKARQQMKVLYLQNTLPGKLLDVGCGDGLYLSIMQGKGWQVEGLDFDSDAVKRAQSVYHLNVKLGALKEMHYPDSSFDAVTLRHVIEHLTDPVTELKECLRILRPTGKLVVVTPNSESLGHFLMKENWRGLEVPRHQNIFSVKSLKFCAEKLGIASENVEVFSATTGADFILDQSFAIRDHQAEEGTGESKKRIHFFRTLKAIQLQYKEQLNLKQHPAWGEEVVMIIRK